ncbi:hypothetical protein [Dyella acidisoli]|uniref:GerMN domain-containing protein n=1 Tax=Dyella acidisoli TaxID=1867834 RepID=A0ABQ5XK50_9GAMM|nr:hypothetical protein [Dyella acidisoli]GLQ91576.1 hypothetical protein GCM10007901_05260 [Dyella acidisoli]
MRFLQIAMGVLVTAIPLCSMACSPASPDANEARHAIYIARGTVQSSRWVPPSRLLVRVTVNQVIKGLAPNSLEAISLCALPVEDSEDVVVFNLDGDLLAYPEKIYGQDIRSAISGMQ